MLEIVDIDPLLTVRFNLRALGYSFLSDEFNLFFVKLYKLHYCAKNSEQVGALPECGPLMDDPLEVETVDYFDLSQHE